MNPNDFKKRTKAYALRIIRLYQALPRNGVSSVLGRQLLRAGTSVGANYRAACRAKSRADFVSKMGTVLEEADESAYWTELLSEAHKVEGEVAAPILHEANELVAIAISSINTAKQNPGAAK